MNVDPEWKEQLGAATAVILAAAIGARKWLRRDREESSTAASYGITIANMREEIERLATLNETLHRRLTEYQDSTLELHAKLEKISIEMIEIAREKEEMKSEVTSLRNKLHQMFNSCGDCPKLPQFSGWLYHQ